MIPKACFAFGLDCLLFISSILDGFESNHFVVSQRSKQPKNVQFEPIIEQEQYDLLLAALCLGRRSPLPFFFCEKKDGRWSTRGRRILGEDGGGGFQTAPPPPPKKNRVLRIGNV